MATVPNLTTQDTVAAADANLIRDLIVQLLNTTDSTAYGVAPRSTAATSGIQLATADFWQRLYADVDACYCHRTGSYMTDITTPSAAVPITAATLNALYTRASECVNDRYTVAPTQLETTSVTEEFTDLAPWSDTATYAFTWTWDSALAAGWHFNLGGSVSFALTAAAGSGAGADLALSQAVTTAASVLTVPYTRTNWESGAVVVHTTTVASAVGDIVFTLTYSKVSATTLSGQILVTTPAGVSFGNALTGAFKTTRSVRAVAAALPVTDEQTRILSTNAGAQTVTLTAGRASSLKSVAITNSSDFETLTITGISATAAGATGYVVSSATDFATSTQLVPVVYPITLAPRASTTVKYFYTRPARSTDGLGTFANSIIITSNSDLGTFSIPVSVTVTAPEFDFSLDQVDYDQAYTYDTWTSNSARRALGVAIADRFYLPNTDFGLVNYVRRYALNRKPDYAGLDYWTTVCATSYSSDPTSAGFTERFFSSINPASADFGRSLTGDKAFDPGWGYGDFYDRSLVSIDVASGSNKYYKYYIRPEYGTVKSYESRLSDFKFNGTPVLDTSVAARAFAVDNYFGTAPAADAVVCISVIDESSVSSTTLATLWANFRKKYPTRPFYLLCPNTSYAPLKVPAAFLADPLAHVMTVNRSGSDVNLRDDWFALCSLDTALAGSRVLLAIDNSGSMRTSTVQASYDYFKTRVAATTLTLTEVKMGGEDWVTPHDAYYTGVVQLNSTLPPSVTETVVTTPMAVSSPIDGPRVRFDPFDALSVGAYTAVLSVTVTAVDLTGTTVTVTHSADVTINITALANGNLANWRSAVGYNNAIMGMSYDRIDGTGYLTVGVGAGGDGSAVAAPTGYALTTVANLGAAADSKYQSGQPLYRSSSNVKWSGFMNTYGVWPMTPVPVTTAPASDGTICISVIDESSAVSSYVTLWANFRKKYPTRPFYLLCPGSSYSALKVPAAFLSDPLAHVMTVNRSGSNTGLRDDWFALCSLNTAPAGTRVLLAIDNSGSMTTNTVRASYEYFKTRIASSTLTLKETTMGRENWVTPHDAYYTGAVPRPPHVFDFDISYTFTAPADADYTLEFQATPGSIVRIDGAEQLSATGVANAPVSKSIYLTAGTHTVSFKLSDVKNDDAGVPNGIAIRISRPSAGTNIWTTLDPVRITAPYLNWAEVYRFPITYGDAAVMSSRNHVIKHSYTMADVTGARITDFFGTTGTPSEASLLTVTHDGYGNLNFDWAFPENSTTSEAHNRTLRNITELPYYYSFSSDRITATNLEALLPNNKTHKLIGMTPELVKTSVVDAPMMESAKKYTESATYRLQVPPYAKTMIYEVVGAGGGGGGSEANAFQGAPGRAGQRIVGTQSVTPGQTLVIYVGAGGGAGASGYSVQGGAGGWGFANSYGGAGGAGSLGSGTSGSGGGGGGASAIVSLSGDFIIVAAGGGGGAGGGRKSSGSTIVKSTAANEFESPGSVATSETGGAGASHTGDGGGGGGGGAGYPLGGAGGARATTDNGAWTGADGSNQIPPNGQVSGTGAAGGKGQVRNSQPATSGATGYIAVSFSY